MIKKSIFPFLLLVLCTAPLFSQESYRFEFETVSDVVRRTKEEFSKIKSYSADFTITSKKGTTTTVQKGALKSLRPNYLIINFTEPQNQRIVSDGKTMWIHIPSMNVVAEQDLKDDSGTVFAPGTYVGLRRLFAKYHYKFASKNQPERAEDGKEYYTLSLTQKESRSGYKTIKLWIAKENYMIMRAEGETAAGKSVAIAFSNISTTGDFSKGLFKMEIPSNAKVIKNPMISEE